jgi:hypothetical protein
MNPQLTPLEVNPLTGEPFLRSRKHKNIIITPPRETDKEAYIRILSDPKVYQMLRSAPVPFTQGITRKNIKVYVSTDS